MVEAGATILPTPSAPAARIDDVELVACIPQLRAFAIALTGSRERGDDLLQDTIVRALSAAHQFHAGTNLRAWMFTILRNLHFNAARKNRVRARSSLAASDIAQGYEAATPPGQDANLEFGDFRRAFWQLAREQRAALILVGANGMSHEGAAKICGCQPGTIKSRVSRGRARLLQILTEGSFPDRRRDTPAMADRIGNPLLSLATEPPAH